MRRLMLTAAALALLTTTARAGDIVVTGHDTIGCVNLNKDVLRYGQPGRIFDLADPDICRGIPVGTAVIEQGAWNNAICVLSKGASPPCLWVMVSNLTYPPNYNTKEHPIGSWGK